MIGVDPVQAGLVVRQDNIVTVKTCFEDLFWQQVHSRSQRFEARLAGLPHVG